MVNLMLSGGASRVASRWPDSQSVERLLIDPARGPEMLRGLIRAERLLGARTHHTVDRARIVPVRLERRLNALHRVGGARGYRA